ncbi:MAG: hypothetical protein INR73_16985 [Williamsia sp.]|nr:hypothetical protein [Williamsia sp.]
MESRNNSVPAYLRNENDDLTEDLAQSLPVDEGQAGNGEQKNNSSPDTDEKSRDWQHRLSEEMGAGREEKDFTD